VKLTHFASVHNNWSRTVSVFSGSQLFNCVGWKVGYAIGPQELIRFGGIIHGAVFYCFNTCGQIAIANSLDRAMNDKNYWGQTFLESTRQTYQNNREGIITLLEGTKFTLKPCAGGKLIAVDVSKCFNQIPIKYLKTHDYIDLDEF